MSIKDYSIFETVKVFEKSLVNTIQWMKRKYIGFPVSVRYFLVERKIQRNSAVNSNMNLHSAKAKVSPHISISLKEDPRI